MNFHIITPDGMAHAIEFPDDQPVGLMLRELVVDEQLKLRPPKPEAWQLVHENSEQKLDLNKNLEENGVRQGERLRLLSRALEFARVTAAETAPKPALSGMTRCDNGHYYDKMKHATGCPHCGTNIDVNVSRSIRIGPSGADSQTRPYSSMKIPPVGGADEDAITKIYLPGRNKIPQVSSSEDTGFVCPQPSPLDSPKPKFSRVQIFYVTDRAASKTSKLETNYRNERSKHGDVRFGVCEVTIPERHRAGRMERPAFLKFQFAEDPSRHIVLQHVQEQSEGEFYRLVTAKVSASAHRRAFVFIHGYNVTFPEAARRTAQLAYDLDFDGAPILYSWPSHGRLLVYPWDEANIEWTMPHLQVFLQKLVTVTGAHTVHLIAHSMGNRALADALNKLVIGSAINRNQFRQVILAAPDIDAEVFRGLAENLSRAASRVTLYFSPNDRALKASRFFHRYSRAGEKVLIVPGVDTVDASAVDTSLLGHSYIEASKSVLSDIFHLLSTDAAPGKRFAMKTIQIEQGTYYAFRP